MFDTNKFAPRLQSLRKTKNLSQQQLADSIGVTKSTISRIESASRAASIEIVYELADYFDVSLDFIVGRSDDINTPKGNVASLSKEEELIIKNYRMLNDISKGKLIERSRILLEESGNIISEKKNA